MDPKAIITEIKNALDAVGAFRVYDYQNLDPIEPAVTIYPQTFPIEETWSGSLVVPQFVIKCYAPYTNDRAGTDNLLDWCGRGTENSIADALKTITAYNLSTPVMQNWQVMANATQSKLWLTAELVFDAF